MMRTTAAHGALMVALTLCLATAAAAQIGPGITPDVVSRADPSQRYAVYLPTAYTPERRWPLAIVMDPRGRALVPLERMTEAAERLGYIVFSSYNTASDSLAAPDELAVRAIIDDAQELFSIHAQRLYFVGHSGTARHAWEFAERFAPYTAGIIAFGAGLPNPVFLLTSTVVSAPAFSVFGGAGDIDYNYEEVRHLDWRLGEQGLTHAVEFYPGPHAWPESDVFTHALEWMEVRAVQTGRSARSSAELGLLFDRSLERGAREEERGDVDAAWRVYESAATIFQGLVDTTPAQALVDRLTESDQLSDEAKRLRAEYDDRRSFDAQVAAIVEDVRRSGRPLNVNDVVRELGVERLRRQSSDDLDRAEANAAQRKLESLFVRASFYRPRESIASGHFEVANSYLRLAARIKPDDPEVCLGLGRTWAQMGAVEQALQSLDCALSARVITLRALEADPLLEPLRGEEGFEQLLRRPRQ